MTSRPLFRCDGAGGVAARVKPGRVPVVVYGAGAYCSRVLCCLLRRMAMVGFEGCRGSRLGGCANGRSTRQTDWQAGTPVAEMAGSAQDAYSGSSRMIRFRGRRSGGGGGGRGHIQQPLRCSNRERAAVSRGRQASQRRRRPARSPRASTQLSHPPCSLRGRRLLPPCPALPRHIH